MDARAQLSRRDLPGWFGKLPGMGDFAQRRLPEQFRAVWDSWLQKGLFELRSRQPDWVERYLAGPIWFFALGAHLAGPSPWLGVMMPSVDSAGRYFPLTLAIELTADEATQPEPSQAWALQWWEASAKAALSALESDLDANRFESSLNEAFGGDVDGSRPVGPQVHLPAAYQSIWRTHPSDANSPSLVVTGLPTEASFDALFGYDAGIPRPAEISP